MTTHDTDTRDYLILRTIQDHGPCWKKRVHDHLTEAGHSCSPQTIGRHIDQLEAADLLETAIVSPDDIPRDLIIAYKLTEKGSAALTDMAHDHITTLLQAYLGDTRIDANPTAITRFLTDTYPDISGDLLADRDCDELAAILLLRYALDDLHSTIDEPEDVVAVLTDAARET